LHFSAPRSRLTAEKQEPAIAGDDITFVAGADQTRRMAQGSATPASAARCEQHLPAGSCRDDARARCEKPIQHSESSLNTPWTSCQAIGWSRLLQAAASSANWRRSEQFAKELRRIRAAAVRHLAARPERGGDVTGQLTCGR